MDDTTIVCPGCGTRCIERELKREAGFKRCQECGYENGMPPHRLLTIKELLEFPMPGNWNQINLYEFLNEALPILADIYAERIKESSPE